MKFIKTHREEYVDLTKIKHFWIESKYAWSKWVVLGDDIILAEIYYEKIYDADLAKQKAQEWLDDLVAKINNHEEIA